MNAQEHFDFTSFMNDASTNISGMCTQLKGVLNVDNIKNPVKTVLDTATSGIKTGISVPIGLINSGLNTVSSGITSYTDTVGNTLGNTLQTLAQGVQGGFNILNNTMLGGLSAVNNFDPNASNPTANYRYNSSVNTLTNLADLVNKCTTVYNNIATAVNVMPPAPTMASMSSNVAAVQTSMASLGKTLSGLPSDLAGMTTAIKAAQTSMSNASAVLEASAFDQAKFDIALNSVSTSFSQSTSALLSDMSSIMSTVLNNVNTVGAQLTGSYASLSSADATDAGLNNYENAYTAIAAQISGLSGLIQQISISVGDLLSSLAPIKESFYFVDASSATEERTPFVHTKREVAGMSPVDIFQFKELPIQLATQALNDGGVMQLYEMGRIKYFLQTSPDNVVIEYVEHPIENSDPFQLYVFTVPGEKQPFVFCNYELAGANKTDLDSFLDQYVPSGMSTVQSVSEGYSIISDINTGINTYLVNPVQGAFDTVVGGVESSINQIMIPIKSAARLIFSAISCIGTQISNLGTQLQALPAALGDIVSTGVNDLGSVVSSAVNNIKSLVDTASANVLKIGSSIYKGLKTAWNNSVGLLSDLVNGLVTTMKIIKQKIIDLINFIISLPGKVYGALKTVWITLSSSAENMYSKVQTSIKAAFGFDPTSAGPSTDQAAKLSSSLIYLAVVRDNMRLYSSSINTISNAIGALTPADATATSNQTTINGSLVPLLNSMGTQMTSSYNALMAFSQAQDTSYNASTYDSDLKKVNAAAVAALQPVLQQIQAINTPLATSLAGIAGLSSVSTQISGLGPALDKVSSAITSLGSVEPFAFLGMNGSNWYRSTWFAILLLVIVLCLIAYFVYRRRRASMF